MRVAVLQTNNVLMHLLQPEEKWCVHAGSQLKPNYSSTGTNTGFVVTASCAVYNRKAFVVFCLDFLLPFVHLYSKENTKFKLTRFGADPKFHVKRKKNKTENKYSLCRQK